MLHALTKVKDQDCTQISQVPVIAEGDTVEGTTAKILIRELRFIC